MSNHILRSIILSLSLVLFGSIGAGCVRGHGHPHGRTVHVSERPAPRGRAVGHQAGHPSRGNAQGGGNGRGNNGRGRGNGGPR